MNCSRCGQEGVELEPLKDNSDVVCMECKGNVYLVRMMRIQFAEREVLAEDADHAANQVYFTGPPLDWATAETKVDQVLTKQEDHLRAEQLTRRSGL